jgi:NitT/TauT family transport system permease protein
MFRRILRRALPWLTVAGLIGLWHGLARLNPHSLIPGPWPVVLGLAELARKGLLLRYVVASLFRVTWGYLLAVALAIPCGLVLGWFRRGERAVGPLIQILRPISPLAWIPISILWFGVGDLAAVFLIFMASFLALTVATMNAVHNIDATHLCAGRNFGLSKTQLVCRVLCPAVLPRIGVALRITLGLAWLVVVAAEMLAVRSGLGFLIVDARNAGNRYDLVLGGMASIGVIGLTLDAAIRRIERLESLKWGHEGAG